MEAERWHSGRSIDERYAGCHKKPADVKIGWDLLQIKGKINAEEFMRPIADGNCTRLNPPQK